MIPTPALLAGLAAALVLLSPALAQDAPVPVRLAEPVRASVSAEIC